jgi:hypothetical protein
MDTKRCEPIPKADNVTSLFERTLALTITGYICTAIAFEVRQVSGSIEMQGLNKDVVPDHAKSTTEVEFLLDNPEKRSLIIICRIRMVREFMMVFRYA